jgi:predicted aminopeptidase
MIQFVRRRPWALICFLPLIGGCENLGYELSAVGGEANLLLSAVPIDKALSDPTLTDEERSKLEFVVRARDFGKHVIGLNVGNSYQSFVNLHGKSLAWNLSASRKDRFESYIWNLLIGPLPYLGYFNLDDAKKERDRLVGLGYDTVIYEIDAYSTLGLFPDPVVSPLLRRDLDSLADTVLHESTHNTISKLNDSNFNETVATFVGRTAGVQFLEQEFGTDSDIVKGAREGYEDADRLNAFLQTLTADLNELYNSDASSDDKVARRADVIAAAQSRYAADVLPLMHNQAGYSIYTTLALNNAFLLLNVRYNDGLDVFQQIFDLTGGDWSQALRIFSDAAAVDDSLGYMRGIIDAGSSGG